MKKFSGIVVVAAIILVLGCTLKTEHVIKAHITVDIRHIEEQADDVLDFIESDVEEEGNEQTSGGASMLMEMLEAINPIRSAYAAGLKASSPKMEELAAELKKLYPDMLKLKKSGYIGENYRGYLEILPVKELDTDTERKNKIQETIAKENKIRKELYLEVVRLNNTDSKISLNTIETVYAKKRLQRGKKGEFFKMPKDAKLFGEFKKVLKGKKIEGAVKPDAWIKIAS